VSLKSKVILVIQPLFFYIAVGVPLFLRSAAPLFKFLEVFCSIKN